MKKLIVIMALLLSFVSMAQTQKKVVTNGFACQTKSNLKSLIAVTDLKARATKLSAQVKNGQCINLKKGDAVMQTGTSFVDDLVKIKYASKPTEYWTTTNFLN